MAEKDQVTLGIGQGISAEELAASVHDCSIDELRAARHAENVDQDVREAPYWLCCGSKDPLHRDKRAKSCVEALQGHPERCQFGTKSNHSANMLAEKARKEAFAAGRQQGLREAAEVASGLEDKYDAHWRMHSDRGRGALTDKKCLCENQSGDNWLCSRHNGPTRQLLGSLSVLAVLAVAFVAYVGR